MIYVSQEQLDQVEYLIEQSSRGYHILFDNDVIRRVFSKKALKVDKQKLETESTDGDQEIERHIENIILQPTLISKKAYLEKLHSDVFEKVVRSYFAIVENNIFEEIEFHQ